MKLGALETFWQWRARVEAHRTGEDYGTCWDIETPGLDPSAPLLCTSWQVGPCMSSHVGNILECPEFLDRLTPGQLLIAHNAKFEAQALLARGIDPLQFVWWDTLCGEWVLLANNPRGLGLNLDDSAQRYGQSPKDPWVDEMIKAGKILEIPQDRLLARNVKDVEDTAIICLRQLARMTEAQIRLTIVRSMTAIELAHIEGIPSKRIGGMQLDPVRVKAECARNAAEITEHEIALREITRGANPNSINEMAPVLYGIWPAGVAEADRGQLVAGCECGVHWTPKKGCTACKALPKRLPVVEPLGFKEPPDTRMKATKAWPDGRPSLAKEVMAKLATKARTARQRVWADHYLALTEAIAERDKNLTYYRGVCEQHGGTVFAELMQGVTATHRLSCRGKLKVTVDGDTYSCQLQNTPRHLKGCFVAKAHAGVQWLATSVDQSQAEFRGAVFLGDDYQGRDDIVNPRFDAHIQTLTVMLNGQYTQAAYDNLFDRYKAGDKEVAWQRADNRLCKGHTFKPLFGGSSGTDTERTYYKWFGKHYSGVTETQNAWDQEVQQTGRYVAPTGMVFNWNTRFEAGNYGRVRMLSADSGRSLYSVVRNLPIQYLATGELAMASTLCLLYEARRVGLRYACVMLIHDDTAGEVHPEDAALYHATCGKAYGELTWKFLYDIFDINYDVELAAESKAGVRFGEGAKQEHAYTSPINEDEQLMKVSAKGNGAPRAPSVKAGTHIGILEAIVDLGVQKGSAQYPQAKRKVWVRAEFPNVQVEFKKDDGTIEKSPGRVGRFMALSMNEKATFRKFIESFRGEKFKSDREAAEFDVFTLLGKPGMFPVEHKLVGEVTYANLGLPLPLMEGMEVTAKLSRAPLAFDTDARDPASFALLPKGIQDMINGAVLPSHGTSNAPAPITGGLKDLGNDGTGRRGQDDGDDIPL